MLFKKLGINSNEIWDHILADGGSIQNIDELNGWVLQNGKVIKQEEADELVGYYTVKEVYKTFKEINQLDLVIQAGLRQQYIDQAVSLNLAFPSEASPKWINQVHLEAWKRGVKTLYYMRTESVLRGDIATKAMNPDCLSCDG